MQKIHELKTWPPYFQDVWDGVKKFEVRKDDRDFNIDDILLLKEWDPVNEQYTEREIRQNVDYILKGGRFGIESGYVVLGFK